MSLTLVTGPAGSGKTGEVLERFTDWLQREPVLVVPTAADAERFEDELLARRPVALGGRIVTFEGLFRLAASATGVLGRPVLTAAQRSAVLAAVVRDAGLKSLAEPAGTAGFVDALDRFVAEAQDALVTPADVAACSGRGWTGHVGELARLYRAYVELRDALGRSDAHALASAVIQALRGRPGRWGSRPVLIHGFDDLNPSQLALVEALAAEADVVVSVLHEAGRVCLAARGRLVAQIEAMAGSAVPRTDDADDVQLSLIDGAHAVRDLEPSRVDLLPRQGGGLLRHLERSFLTDAPSRREPDGSIRLLRAAGVRGEIEQVAAGVARLLRDGVAPDQIAVIARSLEGSAELVDEVFRSLDIPVSMQAERRLVDTATGRGLVAAIRATLTTRSAADLVTFLRCPGRAPRSLVDRLERAIRLGRLESADEAMAAWRDIGGGRPQELERLRRTGAEGSPALLDRLAELARDLAERPLRRQAPVLPEREVPDQVVAEVAATWLTEVAEAVGWDDRLAPDAGRLVTLLESLRVPRPGTPGRGRVEVLTPYRARARQFPYVFLLSLQEGEFPLRRRDDPFLTDAERRGAGLPQPADQRDEERYLFYVCLTRATRTLHLSYRSVDDEGRAVTRSFFVDEVLDLLAPGVESRLTESRGLSDTMFAPAMAPSERELARSLAELRRLEPPASLGASEAVTRRLGPALRRARERADRLPGSLQVPYVLEQFAGKRLIGASSLELNAECSFRYFVDHELDPRELAPVPEPLTRGGMTHTVLERLYEERGERPTPDTLDHAVARAGEILAEEAAGTGLDPRRPASRPAYRRMESDIARYLRYDAAHGAGELAAVEASFGAGDDDDRPPLRLAGFELHGKVDRIDRVAGGQALVRDYKTGATVASRKEIAEKKRLQLPLYMLAVRELWGLPPIGAAYHPLGKQYDAAPRGILRGPPEAWPLRERFKRTDFTADEAEFEAVLDGARQEGERLAERIQAGHLARDPLGGSCPEHCDFHPICRRERGDKNPEENGRREDDENGDE